MLIKPIVTQLLSQNYFKETKASTNIPSLDNLTNNDVILPICYFLPVQESGKPISADNRPKQQIMSTYSFCIVAEAGDFNSLNELPITEAKEKLIEALMGFSISPVYGPMEFLSGQVKEVNTQYESWIISFQATRTFRKK